VHGGVETLQADGVFALPLASFLMDPGAAMERSSG